MRFVGKLPEDGINLSKEHPLKEATVLVVGLGLVFALIFVVLVWFVEIVVAFIPPKAEARVFSSWGPERLEQALDDDRSEAVEALLARLAAHWPDAPYTFRVAISPGDEPNAFALPGGLILVTEGLLDEAESENELALILGHELGHFKNRDHLRSLGRALVLQVAIATLFGSTGDSLDLASVIGDLTEKGFGRSDELEADRFGLGLVHATYGHITGAEAFFARMQEDEGGLDRAASYLSTHPASTDRVEQLAALAAAQGWRADGDLSPLPEDW